MSENAREPMVRTTVRLNKATHIRLKEAAAQAGMSAEAFIARAVVNETETSQPDPLGSFVEWNSLFGQRFLDCLPTPAVIKDSKARIVWCNIAYEDLFGRPKGGLLGQRISEMGLLDKNSAFRLSRDIKALQNSQRYEAWEFWEPLTFAAGGGTTSLFRAHRFLFKAPDTKIPFIGDVSFDWGQIVPGLCHPISQDLQQRLRSSVVVPQVGDLFIPFLNSCPAAVAIKKNLDCTLLWCNTEYEKLADAKYENLRGLPTRKIFNIDAFHPVVQNEHTVSRTSSWMYAIEELPKRRARTSLRFPIIGGAGRPSHFGVISAEFQQEDIHSHAWQQKARKGPGAGSTNV